MKIRFTEVVTKEVGGSYEGTSAAYEVTDSDGAGNFAVDSGSLAAPSTGAPVYASIAAVEALTQTQIYNDFYDTNPIDSFQTIGEAWKEMTQSDLDGLVGAAQVASGAVTFETADEITDQEPITI